ncbi:MAG: outer membrane protein assembly factor BamA [Holosporales bacterium]|jgi:outer membrane protein insertion porin family|nr:outer membrane protein assembly factor BamA [Holosporales bacterium]
MRKLLIGAALIALVACDVSAEKVSKIEYVGCKRIDKETVEAYMPIRIGDDCDDSSINGAVKILDQTGFFESVNIVMKGNTVVVSVMEYPIINAISFEGNKKISDKDIQKAIPLKPGECFSPTKVRELQQGLLESYRGMGRFGARVNPKVIRRPDGRIDLVVEIDEGVVAGIGRIVFIGNDSVSSSDLRDVIHSKVERWYRFFVTDDKYDPGRMNEDKEEIRKYYHNNGYPDADVTSAIAELSPNKKEFYLTFTIHEGMMYKFGKVTVKSLVPKIKVDGINRELYSKQDEKFNASLLEVDSANIVRKIGSRGTAVTVKPRLSHDKKRGVVDVAYEIFESDRIYVSKIIISGNTKTRDHVIRREIQIEEGDVYNQALVTLTEHNIEALGFFKNVNVQTTQDPNSPDKCIIQISVEEAPTANAMANASYSPLGGIGVNMTYNERNFYGTGKILSVFLGCGRERAGRRSVDGKPVKDKAKFRFLSNVRVSLTEPRLMDKDIEGTVAAHRYITSIWDGFTVKELGGSLGVSYMLSNNWGQGWEYEAVQRKFNNIATNVSPLIVAQVTEEGADGKRSRDGKCGISSIKHTVSYGKSFVTGIKGRFSASLETSIAGLGGTAKHIKNELSCSYAISLSRKSTITTALSCGMLSKFGGKDPHIIDSFMLGGESFRGFDFAGMGPMSETTRFYEVKNNAGEVTDHRPTTTREFVGGTRHWKCTIEYKFPLGMPEELQMRGFTFTDFGTVWKPTTKGNKYWQDLTDVQKGYIAAHDTDPNDPYKFKIADEDKRGCKFDDKIVGHKLYDKKKIRMSFGFGVSFATPLGPISLSYAIPFKKEKYDEQYRLLFSFSPTM